MVLTVQAAIQVSGQMNSCVMQNKTSGLPNDGAPNLKRQQTPCGAAEQSRWAVEESDEEK